MQNGHDESKEEHSPTDETANSAPCLFSQLDIKNIIKDFHSAWLRNEVSIDFPKTEDIRSQAKVDGEKLDKRIAHREALGHKVRFLDLIAQCTDISETTLQQQQKALNELYQLIVAYRIGDRIKGKWGESYHVREQLEQFDQRLQALEKTVEEMYILIRTHIHKT